MIQRVVNKSPLERFEWNTEGKLRRPMEVFSGLKPQSLIIRPLPMKVYRDLKAIGTESCRNIKQIMEVHQALNRIHNEVSESSPVRRAMPQIVRNEHQCDACKYRCR